MLPLRRVAALDSADSYSAALEPMAEGQNWEFTVERDLAALVAEVAASPTDLVVVNFADIAGPEEWEHLTATVSVPLLAVVASSEELRAALQNGAAATVFTPCDPDVMVLTMGALMRWSLGLHTMLSEAVQLDDLTVSLANHTVARQGRRQALSPTEWQLFAHLLANPGKIFSRNELAEGSWGAGHADRFGQTELYISRLRRKVERDPRDPQIIETVRGQGYRLRPRPMRTGQSSTGRQNGVGLLSGELDDATSPAVIARWKRVYSQLVDAKRQLIVSAKDQLDRLLPEVQSEILTKDIEMFEADLARLQHRLDRWSARHEISVTAGSETLVGASRDTGK